jgi:CRP-like cAMP-binding protein
LRGLVGRYLYVGMAQLIQSAACGRFHGVRARLARWLMVTRDRTESHRLSVTHDFLASMLGVRRVGVTNAVNELQRLGWIRCRRGHIEIVNVKELARAACGCYAIDRAMYTKVMGHSGRARRH